MGWTPFSNQQELKIGPVRQGADKQGRGIEREKVRT